MPFVLVEVAPADVPAALAQKLVEACSATVIEGRCALSGAPDSADADAVAIVRWEDAGERRVQIQVGVAGGKPSRWERTVLEFRDIDVRAERFRAVGLTIATLAGQVLRARGEEASPPDAAQPGVVPRPKPKPKPRPKQVEPAASGPARVTSSTSKHPSRPGRERDERSFWVSGGALGGPGLAEGAPRVGAFLGIAWRPTALPVTGVASASYAARLGDEGGITVRFAELGAGAGILLPIGSSLFAEGRLEGVLRLLDVQAFRGERSDSGGTTVLGAAVEGRLGLRGAVLGPFVGLRASKATSEAEIRVGNREVGLATAWAFAAELGLAWAAP